MTVGTGHPTATPAGEGFALSFGDLPGGAAGELGSGAGLRVRFLTRRALLSVRYAERELLSAPLAELAQLRANSSFPLLLMYRVRGGAHGLTLRYGNTTAMEQVAVAGWAPQPHWRFGFSARNRLHADTHVISGIRLESGALLNELSLPLEVTANGQQHSASGAAYTFYGRPTLSAATPALGPADGGTRVVVGGRALFGGGAYRCHFGVAVVFATFDAASETVPNVPTLKHTTSQKSHSDSVPSAGKA